jgi:hypothetical protein
MGCQAMAGMARQVTTLALADAATTNPRCMTIVQQIQIKRHVADILRRRGIKLGTYPEYEKRLYNIYVRAFNRQKGNA